MLLPKLILKVLDFYQQVKTFIDVYRVLANICYVFSNVLGLYTYIFVENKSNSSLFLLYIDDFYTGFNVLYESMKLIKQNDTVILFSFKVILI